MDEWILINLFGAVKHGPMTSQLDFGGDQDSDPGYRNPYQDSDL